MLNLGMKPGFFLCLVAMFIAVAYPSAVPSQAENSENHNDVFFGPGVIYGCKAIQFFRPVDPHKEKALNVYCQDTNFNETRTWVFHNIYKSLNRSREVASSKPEYCIALYTLERHDMTDVLLIVPLNRETLGPSYEKKIAEIRHIMTNRTESVHK